jgi:hypothetical protein
MSPTGSSRKRLTKPTKMRGAKQPSTSNQTTLLDRLRKQIVRRLGEDLLAGFVIDRRPPSWNDVMRLHWGNQRRLSETWELLMLEKIQNAKQHSRWRVPVGRVRVQIESYTHTHHLDPDNICAKPILDALKARLIHDDSPVYIAEVRLRSYMVGIDESVLNGLTLILIEEE